jgi:hypothetical protein
MWRELNKIMKKNGVEKPNFKGFMVDNAHAYWNVVRIIYGTSNPKALMNKFIHSSSLASMK